MRKVRKFLGITAWLAAIMLLACACNDSIDTNSVYRFDLETMPVQKRIIEGETAEIRCTLVKQGDWQEVRFYIRMFQTDGKGELRMDDGTVFAPNDLYPLTKQTFRLYYTSHCTDQQSIDVYIQDNLGQVVQKTFTFQDESIEDEGGEAQTADWNPFTGS